MIPSTSNIRIQSISSNYNFHTNIDVLRLDDVHPIISGNKWFKLKEYLREAEQLSKSKIVTYGGPYSNHIVATAAAGAELGFKTIGIIRGEQPPVLSRTLEEAKKSGMDLHFISREQYKNKPIPIKIYEHYSPDDIYVIPEGGYGQQGLIGIKELYTDYNLEQYDYVIAAVGTGTTLAGILTNSPAHQQVLGISVFKNNHSLEQQIKNLLPTLSKEFKIIHDFHFGGYAKHTKDLLSFMNWFYEQTGIPSDFVYTAKMFYAVNILATNQFFPPASKVLTIHSGGLQGNNSLGKGTLIF
jgi:1-aminocyclopropane-1-carboxylate deaminase